MTNRTRTYSWENPLESLKHGMTMSGLEYLTKTFDGSIPPPPIFLTTGFTPISVEEGQVVFELRGQEFQYNPIGSVHGGIISTILDSAIGCTLHSTLPAGVGYTSLDLKVNFLGKITTETPPLRTHTKIIHQGKTTAYLECELRDEQGKVYAHAVSSCMIFR